ncbi:hypothetical protein GCM10011321_07790 [Youhaiella tibetensis]|jgi:hypothetical protein|uniref:Uncharacterized protein n=1 Tax=Paradevosia tibetensis TaxID=1447062 RepID=A0A5B9DRH2_9HYPH|nr:hypothetical protein [Youhaiella tibetensis]AKR55995.1 hypothetical protein XM25_09310 [Devosia sp. H5989]QEE21048.1 hypothetical protein FNA67_13055 [Youhaiella tibetensis]GGF18539.1 hypothetical protein GCM10011321_07790 [Youhaiella tibetensis]
MSELSNLSELAHFVGKSRLTSSDDRVRRRALAGLTARLDPRPHRRGVGDLLGVVLALSARTRRMAMPRVEVEIDVFAPGGKRALRMRLGHPGH